MEIKNVIGIDISKNTLDFCLLIEEEQQPVFYQCTNETKSITATLERLFSTHHLDKQTTLICAEHTGRYGKLLCQAALSNQHLIWMEHPAQIKNSQGIQRGKDDRKDALRIAQYASRFGDRAVLMQPAPAVYEQLAYLSAERDLLLTDVTKYRTQLKEEQPFTDKNMFLAKRRRFTRLIAQLQKAIDAIEQQIDDLINNDPACKQQYKLLTSVDGIGKQVALHTIIETRGFTRFTDPRKFACHAGVAPFKYWSGTSIRSANKVSHRANKKIKQLLHMAAMSAIRMKNEIRTYYERKVAAGKNKMSIINAIRAKLIARMFAVIRNDTLYQKNPLKTLC